MGILGSCIDTSAAKPATTTATGSRSLLGLGGTLDEVADTMEKVDTMVKIRTKYEEETRQLEALL
jgi:hypothetical protein